MRRRRPARAGRRFTTPINPCPVRDAVAARTEARHPLLDLVPGILHVLLFTAAAYVLAHFTADVGVEVTALGVVLGVIAGNLHPVGRTLFGPGVRFVGKHVLAAAVVLLGLRVTVGDVLGLGLRAGAVVLLAVTVAVLAALLFGRLLGTPRPLAALIGAGTGICGASAIAAVRGAVDAEEHEVTYAVAAITFLGSVGLLAYPFIQLVAHPLSPADFGVWAGSTLHSVPQAVGAGFAGAGLEGGAAATVVKLSRVVLLAPVALLLALAFSHRRELKARERRWVPPEVVGFLILFAAGSVFPFPRGFLDIVGALDRFLLVAALTALGLQTRFTDLAKAGAAPFVVALATWSVVLVGVVVGLRLTVG